MIETAHALPASLATVVADYTGQRVIGGCSGAAVYRLMHPGRANLYLKIGEQNTDRSLDAEMQRLRWLDGKLPVPKVHGFARDGRYDYLLISEIGGIDTSDKIYGAIVPQMVRQLAVGLRLLHSLPIAGCPFDESLHTKRTRARARIEGDLVDLEQFDPVWRGKTIAELLAILENNRPLSEDLVFTHGDYCLPNILLEHGRFNGFIDLGRAGVADRYQDLALAARSLARNFGDEWVPLLFAAYGIEPDQAKIGYYKLLDEFF